MKNAKQYFDNHPLADVLWFTTDGVAFFDEHAATDHARKLDDDTVTEVTRVETENGQAN